MVDSQVVSMLLERIEATEQQVIRHGAKFDVKITEVEGKIETMKNQLHEFNVWRAKVIAYVAGAAFAGGAIVSVIEWLFRFQGLHP